MVPTLSKPWSPNDGLHALRAMVLNILVISRTFEDNIEVVAEGSFDTMVLRVSDHGFRIMVWAGREPRRHRLLYHHALILRQVPPINDHLSC